MFHRPNFASRRHWSVRCAIPEIHQGPDKCVGTVLQRPHCFYRDMQGMTSRPPCVVGLLSDNRIYRKSQWRKRRARKTVTLTAIYLLCRSSDLDVRFRKEGRLPVIPSSRGPPKSGPLYASFEPNSPSASVDRESPGTGRGAARRGHADLSRLRSAGNSGRDLCV